MLYKSITDEVGSYPTSIPGFSCRDLDPLQNWLFSGLLRRMSVEQ